MIRKSQTRDGRPVEIKFTDGRGSSPIGAGNGLYTWHADGRIYDGAVTDVRDLVNITQQCEGWVIMHKKTNELYDNEIYNSKTSAEDALAGWIARGAANDAWRVLRIEWEE